MQHAFIEAFAISRYFVLTTDLVFTTLRAVIITKENIHILGMFRWSDLTILHRVKNPERLWKPSLPFSLSPCKP